MVSVDSISISDVFDGGNIKLVESVSDGQGQHRIHLRIEGDTFTELEKTRHCQYFSFRSTLNELETGESKTITFVIENAYDVSYPVAWKGTTVFYT